MRVMLNQRIWRRATSSASAQVAAATLQLSGVRVTSLALSHSTRTLQTAARRSPLRAAPSLLVHTTEPLRCSARVFSVYSASGDPGPAELEKLKKLQDFELGEDPDGTEEPIDEVEAAHLAMLDRAFKGDKNWHVAQDILDMIKDANGDGLTLNIVTALIEVFAIRHRPDECLETLRYTREQGMRPRIHAYSTTIACCYKQLKYLHALRVFEIMRNDGYVPQQVTYSRALSAALKSSQHELVLEIFDDMMRHRVEPSIVTYNSILNSCARNGDVHSALGVLRAVRERNLELTQSSYHSLAICGGKTGHWELARDAYNGLRDAGYTPTMTMYNSVISAYAKGKRWNDIVELYFEMPDDMKGMLHQAYLGAVLMGFAKSENPEIQRKTLEVYEAYKAQGRMHDLNLFAHNAVVMYLLDSHQLDRVHAFAQEMKDNGIEWDGLTYQSVILAHIRAEDIKTAQHLLTKHAKAMQFSTVCYRELIQYFGDQKQDPLTACRLSMQMMQHNARLSRLDWHTALDFALKSGKKAVYWNFRKWMKVRASSLVNDMPAELMLNDEEEPRPKRRAKHQTPRKP